MRTYSLGLGVAGLLMLFLVQMPPEAAAQKKKKAKGMPVTRRMDIAKRQRDAAAP